MRKIGIIGGTFDPVHYGHLILAEQARVEASLDQVIFMPAKIQPFKLNAEIADSKDRYAMLTEAIAGNPGFTASRKELDSPGISYTINTLKELRNEAEPDTSLYFILGTDAFLMIENWRGADQLLSEFAFIVGTRPGYMERELVSLTERLKERYSTEILSIHNAEVEISSTEIKQRILDGKSIKYLLPEKVEKYIYKNGLYK